MESMLRIFAFSLAKKSRIIITSEASVSLYCIFFQENFYIVQFTKNSIGLFLEKLFLFGKLKAKSLNIICC